LGKKIHAYSTGEFCEEFDPDREPTPVRFYRDFKIRFGFHTAPHTLCLHSRNAGEAWLSVRITRSEESGDKTNPAN